MKIPIATDFETKIGWKFAFNAALVNRKELFSIACNIEIYFSMHRSENKTS